MARTTDEKGPQIGAVEEAGLTETHSKDAPANQPETDTATAALHGPRLWGLVAVLYLGLYLLALELTMLSTVLPTLTEEFHTVADISWYETACVFIPLVGKFYEQLPVKPVYLAFMLIFEAGLVVCATARSSGAFVAGRAVTGLGSAGQLSGTMLMMGVAVPARFRPVVTAVAISMISVGSMTGPVIAGVLTARAGWRWCFWMLLPMGAIVIFVLALTHLPEHDRKPPLRAALRDLPARVDPLGFLQLAGAVTMLLLALSWGGGRATPWSSPTIAGLLAGGAALLALFGLWVRRRGDDGDALIPPSCLARRSVSVGGLVAALQGGASQAVPFYLPLWFQAVRGDGPGASAVHLLPSLVAMTVAVVAFGALVRRTRYVPPWAVAGSALSCVGAGLLTTLKPSASVGSWVGYQVLTSIGRGISFQAPITSVQEFVPVEHSAMSMSVISLCLQLGLAVSVSASQTIFANQLPVLMHEYAPSVNITMVQEAGAPKARHVVSAEDLPGFLKAYNQAVTEMFYFPTAACALAAILSLALEWKELRSDDKERKTG
ncbi:MFS transporter [Cordyceps javanica]|uniref:MFS transporter n=1 Tax=Cordyceps javanica TaxID=43265 RepID=A0A545UQT2_9HYPO|nr:MFS transporter [Cordyceps javanica]TQW03773.1 MFS transporter [Cordyceps javanica]